MKVKNTRTYFLNVATELRKAVTSSPASVKFREASYLFHKAVRSEIEDVAKAIFVLPEDMQVKLTQRDVEVAVEGRAFALKEDADKEQYRIDPSKVGQWKEKLAQINLKYADALKESETKNKEFNEWCDQEIELEVSQLEPADIPSFELNGKESLQIYFDIRELFTENKA